MDLRVFNGDNLLDTIPNITRAETICVQNDGQQFRVFMLDADDSLDLVVHYPSGEREIVWSLIKDPYDS